MVASGADTVDTAVAGVALGASADGDAALADGAAMVATAASVTSVDAGLRLKERMRPPVRLDAKPLARLEPTLRLMLSTDVATGVVPAADLAAAVHAAGLRQVLRLRVNVRPRPSPTLRWMPLARQVWRLTPRLMLNVGVATAMASDMAALDPGSVPAADPAAYHAGDLAAGRAVGPRLRPRTSD